MSGRTLAVYDFDGTMIRGDSIVAYLAFAVRRGCLSPFGLAAAAGWGLAQRLGAADAAKAKARALRFRKRMTPEQRRALDEAFAERLFHRVRPAALLRMAADQAAGRYMVLLSASTDHYMEPLNRLLGFDLLVCTRERDLDRPEGNCRGAVKADRLKAALSEQGVTADWADSWAYGDSAGDAAVLELVGHPVLVCPGRAARNKLAGRFPVEDWSME